MSKGLEAIKLLTDSVYYALIECKENISTETKKAYLNAYNTIEKELKEKEQQDSVLKILKEVIEFAQILPHIEPNKDNGFDIMSAVKINIQRDIENRERELLRQWVLKTCFPKELKALEIIKEKEVNFQFFKMCVQQDWKYEHFERYCQDNNEWEESPAYRHSMSNAELELLKEVFECDKD